MRNHPVSFLFSYGTLQQADVQRAVFGRELEAIHDALPGFELATLRISDPAVIATSGTDQHPILRRSSQPGAGVDGVALTIIEEDVRAADTYEVDDYKRVVVELASGRRAYVYVAKDEI